MMLHPDDIYLLIIGLAVGFPLGSWVGWALAPRVQTTELGAEGFEPSMAWTFERIEPAATFRGLPVEVKPKPAPPYSVGKDETILNPLLSMLLNEYSGGDAIPRTGVPLTWRLCSKWGMKRAGWRALCEYVFPGRGYLAPGPGGKRVTVLAAARAREFVRKARKLGRVATPLPEGAVYPEI